MTKLLILYNNNNNCMEILSTYSKAASIRFMKHRLQIIQHILAIKGIDSFLFKEYIYPYISYDIHMRSPIYLLERTLITSTLIDTCIHFPICEDYSMTIDINTWSATNTSSTVKIVDIHKKCIGQFDSNTIRETWSVIYHLYCQLYMVPHCYHKLSNVKIRTMILSINTLISQ